MNVNDLPLYVASLIKRPTRWGSEVPAGEPGRPDRLLPIAWMDVFDVDARDQRAMLVKIHADENEEVYRAIGVHLVIIFHSVNQSRLPLYADFLTAFRREHAALLA